MNSPTWINRIYWASTGLFAALMLFSAYAYFMAPEAREGFQHLGFPQWFRMELGAAKALGAIALLAPIPLFLKEWAYAGFFINLISAVIAHGMTDGWGTAGGPLPFLAVLALSRVYWEKRRATLQR
jgi:hypothetical protein